jgi:hypothetical protein
VRSVLTLAVPLTDGDGTRQQVAGPDATGEKASLVELNRTGYRGTNHRLLSWALGLCLTGVKRGPTVKRNHVSLGERRKHDSRSTSLRSKSWPDWGSCT